MAVAWWAEPDVQADRAAFHVANMAEWERHMRWTKPLRMTAQDVRGPKRKFEQGSTLIVRTRLDDGPEAA